MRGQEKVRKIKQVGNYVIYQERLLGQGQYGKVYEASCSGKSSSRYAVKVIPASIFKQSQSIYAMLQQEIEVLKKLRHSNLVCLHEISQSPNNLYLFLDFCNGGDLSSYINSKSSKRLSEMEAIEIFKQFVSGYQNLYRNKIIHRDIKPENIMLHNGKVKLGDFGFGRFVEGNMNDRTRMSIKCTPIYASPQLLKREQYSSKCDVWSSGCLLFRMLFGEFPFNGKDIVSLIRDIDYKVGGRNEFQFPSSLVMRTVVSYEVKNLIQRIFQYDEKDRISWEELFVHPVLKQKDTILGGTEELISENEKHDTIYKSIILNRKHVVANDLVSERIQNYMTDNPKNYQKKQQQHQQPSSTPEIGRRQIIEKADTKKLNLNFDDGFVKLNQEFNVDYVSPVRVLKSDSKDLVLQTEESNPIGTTKTAPTIPTTTTKENAEMPQFFGQKTEQQGTRVVTNATNDSGRDVLYDLKMQKLHEADLEQFKFGKVDKMILFQRNQALFADVIMQLVFASRKKFDLPKMIFYDIIVSLSGFYNFKLQLLEQVFDGTIPLKKIFFTSITEEDFQLYLQSRQGQKTQQKISKDVEAAKEFYSALTPGIVKEVQVQIGNAYQLEVLNHLQDFDKFMNSKSTQFLDYRERFNQVVKIALELIDPKRFSDDINSLKSIRGMQIFSQIEKFMPIELYLSFDFRIFYEEFINKVTSTQLLNEILAFKP